MFVEVESYKHRMAKDLLCSWLEMVERGWKLEPFVWRPSLGVKKELKFYDDSNPYYFDQSGGQGRILFVPDIVVFQRGAAHLLIEVVHTSPVSDEKLDAIKCFFLDQWVQVWEVDADEILRNVCVPEKLNCRLLWEN